MEGAAPRRRRLHQPQVLSGEQAALGTHPGPATRGNSPLRPLCPLLCLLDCLWEGLALRFGSVSETNSRGSVRRLGAALGNKGSAGKSLRELCVWHHLWPFAERGTRIHPSSRTIMFPVRRQQLPLATSLGGQVK